MHIFFYCHYYKVNNFYNLLRPCFFNFSSKCYFRKVQNVIGKNQHLHTFTLSTINYFIHETFRKIETFRND